MTKVFITGVTGYIGGDVLSQLHLQYPDIVFRVLVRTADKGKRIQAQYPGVQLLFGDLSNPTLLQQESADADIIIHCADASDNVVAANAIVTGILQGHNPQKPAYWIHTSGAGIFSYLDTDAQTYGMARDDVFDDWYGIQRILNIPDHAFHRNVDKIVLDAARAHPDVLRAAIISPTTVYGIGRGPCSQRSRQVYELARTALRRGKAPYISPGQSFGCNVHIHDLTDLYIRFFQAALDRTEGLWGSDAYFVAENGEHRWSDVARSIANVAVAEGYLSRVEMAPLSFEDAKALAGFEAASWGLNVRCCAIRARKLLGWQPSSLSLEDELPRIVRDEWELLQREKTNDVV
ncbi:NAD(P)-binding protein [Aspergillus sclerotioniger CBS 115572]|uniref:NAD(P)-binding protein n=1 Tax=Aspergillus sclerotioniger CBS 115572 TaxID=1450535 RepID=A0A317W6A3_9EURO|nr:NAD(P)-binding protein [Aspergillus sclerotioniger CBS 115572]PWY81555.1 NAD(P)-binding protein [Aspergillus sclerotioniger CBS 115572]